MLAIGWLFTFILLVDAQGEGACNDFSSSKHRRRLSEPEEAFAVSNHEERAMDIEERSGCNADNCLRALRRHSILASPFCETFLAIPTPVTTTYVGTGPVSTTTISSTDTHTVFIGGSHLESIPLPTYVSQYPASRVSSGCSCLSVAISTDTVTATNSIITITSVTTTTSTLTGPCATPYPSYNGVYEYENDTPLVGRLNELLPFNQYFPGYTAYDCCNYCYTLYPYFICNGWASGNPGCCTVFNEVPEPDSGPYCNSLNITGFTDIQLFPNYIGGPGPCLATATIQPSAPPTPQTR
ncbi:MAG: hypothetical protein M1838_001027 [Thelocarpon superellum]|nr:MAG: hypothetical protein M1838_001027 [Thelocarpon superellum]